LVTVHLFDLFILERIPKTSFIRHGFYDKSGNRCISKDQSWGYNSVRHKFISAGDLGNFSSLYLGLYTVEGLQTIKSGCKLDFLLKNHFLLY